MAFADVNSSLKLLCPKKDGLERPGGPSEINAPNQPSLPVRTTNTLPKLETSDLVKEQWEFSTVGLSGFRLFDFMNDLLHAATDCKHWEGTNLKNNEFISESALRDLELLDRDKIEQLTANLKAQLLKNLQRLKNEFDLSDLSLSQDKDDAIRTLPKTDIRAFVQGHIDLLN
jgi:hypothetical protein